MKPVKKIDAINKYLDEFCFRYNNRNNSNVFHDTMHKAVHQ